MSRILVVEDDLDIAQLIEHYLTGADHTVARLTSGREVLPYLQREKVDLVILDLMLPGLDGLRVCNAMRTDPATASIPVIMLTARGEEADRILGLDLGADDYVSKPFSIGELLARIRALLRRAQPLKTQPDDLRFDDIVVDFRRYEARRNDRVLELTRKEFGMLRFLAARAGEVVSRDDLLNEVWGYESSPTTRTVDTHVATLRAKLEIDPAKPRHLQTIHGVGYKWVG
jgi:two-component system, OmpR family, alkaline phosphatase synthesis response regulator PhoP